MNSILRFTCFALLFFLLLPGACAADGEGKRKIVSLDGNWQIGEGAMAAAPATFDHVVPVPGLVDMAEPAFKEVGYKSKLRHAFWYHRKFKHDGPVPAMAFLKVNKAMFGSKVILNGTVLGEHLPSFTPVSFDARKALKRGENDILIRVGAFMNEIPKPVPSGWDYEKERFIPGIFDSVELILSSAPFIDRVQAVPELDKNAVTVHAWLKNLDKDEKLKGKVHFVVREAKSGTVVGESDCQCAITTGIHEPTGQSRIPIKSPHLWSPEDPFLYELEASTTGDSLKTRFGMRSFRLEPATGKAMLNGKPYIMRGSNITLYRFFEDKARGNLPWDEEWVRSLHKACKPMHWNTLRYCIGFPPEKWYQIADEEGILIQDEFPIWNMDAKKGDYDAKELASEYREWMQERWNHPCVVIWDACNETKAPETGKAIARVRDLDFSNRPWDNGWSDPVAKTDSKELHPYHFQDPKFKLSNMPSDPGTLEWKPGKNPLIVNEYGWLWLNRDGTPTSLTKELYDNLLGTKSTTEQRRRLYASYTAAETEFWRSRGACAAVLHFCMLGYSRPGVGPRPKNGATSDHWEDVKNLKWEPLFFDLVGDSFAPVGVMIDAWADSYPANKMQEFSVPVINDLSKEWRGTLRFRVLKNNKVLHEQSQKVIVPPLGKVTPKFTQKIPGEAAEYELEAALLSGDAKPIRSLRDFKVLAGK